MAVSVGWGSMRSVSEAFCKELGKAGRGFLQSFLVLIIHLFTNDHLYHLGLFSVTGRKLSASQNCMSVPRREDCKDFRANKTKAEKQLVVTRRGKENVGTGPFSFLSLALFPVSFDICNQSLSTFALVIITVL